MPSEPAESNFKSKVRATAYPCVERNGIIWAYMGPRETPPPLPDIEANMMPRGEYAVQKVVRECNWMQALEGDIDTGHLGFLHLGAVKPERRRPARSTTTTWPTAPPKYSVVDTEFGTSYGAYRPAEDDTYYWRIAHFLFPFYTMIPTGVLGDADPACAPGCRSTTTTRCSGASRRRARARATAPPAVPTGSAPVGGRSPRPAARPGGFEFLPDTTDWLGKFRLAQNKDNDYLIDREAQRTPQLHRHRRHPPAGPGGHREHGRRSTTARTSTSAPPTR